jgi:DNA-binding LytR/AlgR family response regulator
MKCIIVDDDEASRTALSQLLKQVNYIELVTVCSNTADAITALNKNDIDLLFLDIEMPGMTGMELLKNMDIKPMVILTTSHKEYALDAFEHNVIDYLVKPVELPRLMKAITKAKSLKNDSVLVESNSKDYFFIKKNSVLNKVYIKDIFWIEALGDYLTVHSWNEKFILHITLKAIESKLPPSKFVRVHRSHIVQVDNIAAVEDNTIFINNTPIPVGALYKENFIKALNLLA